MFVMQSKDPRFHALPLASQRVAAFADTVNELVYDVLISKVRQRLSDVSRLPIWSSVEEQSVYHLPTFSASPQSYVTNVGEYLLTLPQQLEPLAEGIANSDANNEEAQFFATEWMFKVPISKVLHSSLLAHLHCFNLIVEIVTLGFGFNNAAFHFNEGCRGCHCSLHGAATRDSVYHRPWSSTVIC